MSDVKYIKGQAWIAKVGETDSLVQDQIMVIPGVDSISNVVSLINDVWEDLLSETGTYKTNGKGYFYWEYKQTLVDNPDLEVTVQFECPSPKPGLFEEPYDPSTVQGEYAKYWVGKLKIAAENSEYKSSIQKKEIIFPKSEYLNWKTGRIEEIEEVRVKNNDLGDIENLLGFMF